MRFEHPQLLWLTLLALPVLAAFFWWSWRVKRRLMGLFVTARLLGQLTVGVSVKRQRARAVLVLAAVALLLVCLARPQWGFDWEEARQKGLDIIVALDVSRSMLADDVAPNRLARAKLAALDLKKAARADRVGLVAFAGTAFLQCPLSYDDEVFRQSVNELKANIIPQGGTAIGEAITTAVEAFKEKTDNYKVLVLFTDGEDHDGNAVEAARNAAQENLRVFTVGVGTPNGELLRTVDEKGRTEFIKDEQGNVVKSHLNESLLKEVAQATGGFYLRMAGANTIDLLYERGLAPLPKAEFAAQRIRRWHERYQWVLGLALVLLLIETLVPERKSARTGDAQPGASPRPGLQRTAVLLLLLALPTGADASSREALRDYEKGFYDAAQSEYERLLQKKPTDPTLHFNAGTAAFRAENFPAALAHLNAALTNSAVSLQQRAYYNLGSTHFRLGEANEEFAEKQKHWEQALKSYQNALALRTNDVDAAFNARFVQFKLAELRELQRQLEEARRAKRRAEEAVKRNDYETALRIMAPTLTNSAAAKEMRDYVQRLQQIYEIDKPPQP